MQQPESRFQKVAAVSRFLTRHPKLSRFIAEHPRTSRFIFRVAHHIPVLDRYFPLAPHISSAFVHRSEPRHHAPAPPRFRL